LTYAVGLDIGGTHIKVVAVTPEGALLAQATEETAEEAHSAWAGRVRARLAAVAQEQDGEAAWIGVAAPGLAAADGRSIAWMQGRMAAVQGLDWTASLEMGVAIPVLNDAQAALLGEVWKGAAAGSRNALLLTLGTGVGGAALIDGVLLRGQIGRAGHLGHLCLNPDGAPDIVGTPGSLEDAIGECTLRERTQGRFTTTQALVAAHRAGDTEAGAVWLRSVYLLACGIVSLINAFDPEIVVVGGGIANSGPALFDPLQAHLDRLEWRPTGSAVRIVPAALGEWAGAFGAAYNAIKMDKNGSGMSRK
jgi:glucokinase